MFQKTKNPNFKVVDIAKGRDGQTVYLKWIFTAESPSIAHFRIEGMSEVFFLPSGLVASHIDYWDAASQFYGRIPILKGFFAWLRRKSQG
jgi:hypothetical protein